MKQVSKGPVVFLSQGYKNLDKIFVYLRWFRRRPICSQGDKLDDISNTFQPWESVDLQ